MKVMTSVFAAMVCIWGLILIVLGIISIEHGYGCELAICGALLIPCSVFIFAMMRKYLIGIGEWRKEKQEHSCSTCVYWKGKYMPLVHLTVCEPRDEYRASCHRYPPVTDNDGRYMYRPQTYESDFCGEFERIIDLCS